jgi:prophage antirepressor-like protein
METKELINEDLGLRLNYWNGAIKDERVFLATQIMKQLGYVGGRSVLASLNLIDKFDMIKVEKKNYPKFFSQLSTLNVLGQRAGSVIMLYESGVWKLIMQSKKQIGINTRNWLANEVLPSIRQKGYYDIKESQFNPLSYLNEFTENKKQIENSKIVNRQISQTTGDYSGYHNQVHKLVNGMTAKEIQLFFQSKKSAREILRDNLPEKACTEAVIDELFVKYGKTLEEIEKSNAHKTLPPAFKSLFDLGIKILNE